MRLLPITLSLFCSQRIFQHSLPNTLLVDTLTMNVSPTHNRNTIVFDGFATTNSYLAELKEQEQHNSWIRPSFHLDSKVVQPPNKMHNEVIKASHIQDEDEEEDNDDDESSSSSESSDSPIPWIILIPTQCTKTLSTRMYQEDIKINIPMDDECSSLGMSTQDSEDYEEELQELARWESLAALFLGSNLEKHHDMAAPLDGNEPNWGEGMSFHEYCHCMGLEDNQSVDSTQTETTCHYYFPSGLLDA
jgi:hypothetical protein